MSGKTSTIRPPATGKACAAAALLLVALGSCSDASSGLPDGRGGTAGAPGGAAGKAGAAPAGGRGTAGSNPSGGQSSGGAAGRGGSAGSGGAAGGSSAGSGQGGSAGATATGGGAGRGGAGRSGTGGSSGGSAGRGGASGAGGTSGGSAAGGSDDGGAPATTGGCADSDVLLCEDFEETETGDVPNGWTRHGDLAAVDDDDAHGGTHSLKLGATSTSERRIYHDAALLGSAHWGRVFYKVKTPVPDAFVHSTLVSFLGDGPKNGLSEFRVFDTIKQDVNTQDVGGRHNFIYNVQIIGKSEFGRETNYDYTFDGKWHCVEYHIDASNQSYELFLDGDGILDFEDGAGNYDDSDIPNVFDELRVGWVNYQNASPGFTAWLDDLAFDDARIGCD